MPDIFGIIFTNPILNGLMLLYQLFHDMGLSIIVLTLIIRLILFPLTLKQLHSMKAQQALAEPMAEIRKKYADNPQQQYAAMQALYKEYGFSPFASGCLPLLMQLPILYGLFYALSGVLKAENVDAINSHLYPFVSHFTTMPDVNLNWFTVFNPAWHINLSQPDPTFILPVLAALATFVQVRMSIVRQQKQQPTKKTSEKPGAPDPSSMMKYMQYISPVMTLMFGLNFAAGLALYWTTSSVFQVVQQYFVTGWGAFSSSKSPSDKGREPQVKLAGNGSAAIVEGSLEKVETNRDAKSNNDNGNGSSSKRRKGSASARRRGLR